MINMGNIRGTLTCRHVRKRPSSKKFIIDYLMSLVKNLSHINNTLLRENLGVRGVSPRRIFLGVLSVEIGFFGSEKREHINNTPF